MPTEYTAPTVNTHVFMTLRTMGPTRTIHQGGPEAQCLIRSNHGNQGLLFSRDSYMSSQATSEYENQAGSKMSAIPFLCLHITTQQLMVKPCKHDHMRKNKQCIKAWVFATYFG